MVESNIRLLVRCPFCSYEAETRTVLRVTCRRCLGRFRVFYREAKNRELKNRVVKILKGSEEDVREEVIRRVLKGKVIPFNI